MTLRVDIPKVIMINMGNNDTLGYSDTQGRYTQGNNDKIRVTMTP